MSLELHDGGVLAREEIPSSDVVRERFGYLDGLRSLAILAVLVAEVAKHANLAAHARPEVAAVYRACAHGLDLFFVISGFALAYPILTLVHQEGHTYLDVSRYALKRILRIVPTYYVAIALMVLVPLLATQLSLVPLEGAVPNRGDIVRQALFAGNAIPNDGFWSLALTMRWYVLFPFLVLLWVRWPLIFFGATAAFWILDLFTPAHGAGVGVLPAFMLGILAADIRAQRHRIERLALPLALVAGVIAVYLEPALSALPGAAGQPAIYSINPAWQVALFFLLVGVGFFGVIERVFGLRIFGMLAAASFAISLIADPVTSFLTRQLALHSIGPEGAAANAGAIAIIMGVVFWQVIDRWFSDGNLRERLVDVLSPPLRTLLTLARAANVYYAGRGRLRTLPPADAPAQDEPQTSGFYAPPPRGSGDLAVVMQRTGSPEQLAAEILETKKRLAEQSAALFADPEPEPVVPVREPERPPGFYEHGQRAAAAPLDAPVSIDADPFVAGRALPSYPQLPPAAAAPLPPYVPPPAHSPYASPPPSYAQPAAAAPQPAYAPPPAAPPPAAPYQATIGGFTLAETPHSSAPELEGWLIPKSFDDDFARAITTPQEGPPPEMAGWIPAEEPLPPLNQHAAAQPAQAPPPTAYAPPSAQVPPPAPVRPPGAPVTIHTSISQPPSRPQLTQSPAPPPVAQAPIAPPPPVAQVRIAPPPPVAQVRIAPPPPVAQGPIAPPPPPIAQAPVPPPPAPELAPRFPAPAAPAAASPPFAPPPPAPERAASPPPFGSQPLPPVTPFGTPPPASPPSQPIAMPPTRDDRALPPEYARPEQPAASFGSSMPPETRTQPPSTAAQQSYQEPRFEVPAYSPPAYSAPVSQLAVQPGLVQAESARPESAVPQAPAQAAPPLATPLPLQTAPLPLGPGGIPSLPSFRESQEATADQAVRGAAGAEQKESSSPPFSGSHSPPGQRVTISLRPARPPIRVRIGPSPLSAPPLQAPSSNGKHALDDVIDG